MRVHNRDADHVVAGVERMASPLRKFLGLRFRRDGRAYFPFSRPRRVRLDMLFVPRPLDIAFIRDGAVQELRGALPVTTRPSTWRTYAPRQPCDAVLEVEHGLFEEQGWEEGDSVRVLGDADDQQEEPE